LKFGCAKREQLVDRVIPIIRPMVACVILGVTVSDRLSLP
jgi:hypothetical protein